MKCENCDLEILYGNLCSKCYKEHKVKNIVDAEEKENMEEN